MRARVPLRCGCVRALPLAIVPPILISIFRTRVMTDLPEKSPAQLASARTFTFGGIRPSVPSSVPDTHASQAFKLEYEAHAHLHGQLLFARTGVLVLDVAGTRWIAPPMRAIWMPPQVVHALRVPSDVELHSLFFDTALCASLPSHVCAVHVSPLLRELAPRVPNGMLEAGDAGTNSLASLITRELLVLSQTPLSLPMPADRRLVKLCERLHREPHCEQSLDTLARDAALSPRHLARLFRSETGMSVAAWRRQLRLAMSLVLLASGTPVTHAANQVGYRSATTYAATFKRAFGVPPSQYFDAQNGTSG
jgi:AraC-like DNA-binding protein